MAAHPSLPAAAGGWISCSRLVGCAMGVVLFARMKWHAGCWAAGRSRHALSACLNRSRWRRRRCLTAWTPTNPLCLCMVVHPCVQLISLAAVRAEVELIRAKSAACGSGAACNDGLAASSGFDAASEAACDSAHAAALLEWTQAVCAQYKLPVRSFGACFSDGSVFCLLVRSNSVGPFQYSCRR